MNRIEAPEVVRRSALEVVQADLGASFVADHTRWPTGYGDEAGEAAAVATAAGLAELGPFDELLLRGPAAAEVAGNLTAAGAPPLRPAVLPVRPGSGPDAAWFLAPDEVLLLGPIGPWLEELRDRSAGPQASAIEMTGARTAFRLVGPSAAAILAELCPVDTTPRSLAEGALLQAPLAGPRAFLTRQDHEGVTGYTWLVARDEARYVWESVLHVGAAHGLRPVGPAAVGGAR